MILAAAQLRGESDGHGGKDGFIVRTDIGFYAIAAAVKPTREAACFALRSIADFLE